MGRDMGPFRATLRATAPLFRQGLHFWIQLRHRGEGEPRSWKACQDCPAPLSAPLGAPVLLDEAQNSNNPAPAALPRSPQPGVGLLSGPQRVWRGTPFTVVEFDLLRGQGREAGGERCYRSSNARHRSLEFSAVDEAQESHILV
ncbi:hypothetical protein IscW_ISCW001211 [Ixodes scapularis]|uniref:Uncharacterized protein n=1 Tax=Ixodes scapularis TaxID=6945 RepID=B7P3N7_IXOSC|nr:hypothetical protein IscW_ISCW001211 [Ixodes scapularis]|eukprot:XP_002404461.1 hypothetical protein IscW_ISCW001211 [Ixodes scapularis]